MITIVSDYVFNEIYLSTEYIKNKGILTETEDYIIFGGHTLCTYLQKTLENFKKTTSASFSINSSETAKGFDFADDSHSTNVLYCIDLRENSAFDIDDLKIALEKAVNSSCKKFVVMTVLPQFAPVSAVGRISEMEFSVLFDKSPYSDLLSLLREYADKLDLCEVRFDNIYGANFSDDGRMGLHTICKEVLDNMSIKISSLDLSLHFSGISISDAVDAVFTVLKHGKKANIYNATAFDFTAFEIKTKLYNLLFDSGVELDFEKGDITKSHYCNLSNGKLSSLGFTPCCSKDDSLFYVFSLLLDEKFSLLQNSVNDGYDGKIEKVRALELDILKEFDKLCRENDIPYFLSGGSLLGAVRHGGFIPWDDDIDVSMLRKDFERFKKLCADKLPKKYSYQSFSDKSGYHYFFDKITAEDTYFSTKYSDSYDMKKGISLDIFAFDNTAKSTKGQKRHHKKMMNLRLLMNVRWKNTARKGKLYLLSKILLPFLRLFSMDYFSKKYDKLSRKYEKKNCDFVMPPATDHIYRGAMPKAWFEKTVPIKFEGFDTFAPVGYDEYLKIWFGKDYMDLLPVSKQKASHDFYRLDLGSTVNPQSNLHFDNKGELL